MVWLLVIKAVRIEISVYDGGYEGLVFSCLLLGSGNGEILAILFTLPALVLGLLFLQNLCSRHKRCVLT